MPATILITGSNRGIGLELVKQFSQAHWKVLACCRQPNQAQELIKLQANNPSIHIYALDVTDTDQIQKLSDKLKEEHIDILFNNAAIAGPPNAFGSIDYDSFMNTLKTNTAGPVMLAQALLPQLMKGQRKLIVNMSSILGSIELNEDPSFAWFAYRVSKAALNAATKSMAVQLRDKELITISLNPGWVKTEMGGPDAEISPETSVAAIKKILDKVTLSDSGSFISYQGNVFPW